MQNNPIGVFDSGIGGTTVLKAVQTLLPHEDYVFFGDSKNCPFGTKSSEELKVIVKNAIDFLLKKQAKLIIVACNTATTQAIDFLRKTYPDVPFVGTEPAIKLACDSGKENLVLLSTEGTAHSSRTKELIKNNIKAEQKIINLPCLGLAEVIETRNLDAIRQNLAENFSHIENPAGADVVILGCTHYPLVREEIQKFFPNAVLIDGGEGVARQTKRLLTERGFLNPKQSQGTVEYHFSKKITPKG